MNADLISGYSSLVLGIVLVATALFVFALAPSRPINRAFLLFIAVSGPTWLAYAAVVFIRNISSTVVNPAVSIALWRVIFVGLWLMIPLWLHLVGVATSTPWLRWLNHPLRLVAFIVGSFVVANWLFVANQSGPLQGLGLPIAELFTVATAAVVVVAAWTARQRATPGSLEHRRLTAFFVAFVVHDVSVAIGLLAAALGNLGLLGSQAADGSAFIIVGWTLSVTHVVVILGFVPLLLYGILAGNLLDIDRRFHFTISKTTVAAVFIAVFVAVQTLVSEYVTSTAGLIAGAGVAGILVFVLSPLQRAAERLADKAVPQGRHGSKMSKKERETFYREQVEIAYSDGSIGVKERKTLRNVRERMGLSDSMALRIEDAVVG